MANLQILSTKLTIPQIQHNLVSRPRLIARLNEGSPRKHTLVGGPAGFGKTILLCDWIKQGTNPAKIVAQLEVQFLFGLCAKVWM